MSQSLRRRVSARLGGEGEAGFTLIELLVVMLILGILAAIALPAFFNQKGKANDAKAKEYAHSAQVAMETYATANGGSYSGVTTTALKAIEPTLASVTFSLANTGGSGSPSATAYRITVTSSPSTQTFSIDNNGGVLSFPCAASSTSGCPSTGLWG